LLLLWSVCIEAMKKPAPLFLMFLIVLFSAIHVHADIPAINPSQLKPESDQNYDVRFYFLDLNISDSSTYIKGRVTILITPKGQTGKDVCFDMLHLLHADSVRINKKQSPFNQTGDILKISLPILNAEDSLVTIDVFYHGLGITAGDVPGIYNKSNVSVNKRITWTLSESFHAMSWFPCKQSLTDKADSVYIFLSTDKNLKAGSNGLLTAIKDLPDNRVRYEWKSRYPIDFYLISFAVGDYRDYSFYAPVNDKDSVLIQNYIYNNEEYYTQNKPLIDKTSELIKLYSGLFGDYPFKSEKYGHCVAPSGGGMEHQTMTTLVNFSFLLVAHELTHQWFGDYVTCKTWQDIWVNEGFASYSEYLANQYLVSQSEAESWMVRTQNFVKSMPGGSVYVPVESADNEDRIFDYRLTYGKGAAILHMIRQEVGNDELFFNILREFLRRYKNSTAAGNDFRDLCSEMTGRSFDRFFEQWYTGEGYPVLTVNWFQRNDTLYFRSLETTSSTTPLFNSLVEYKVTLLNGDTLITHRQESGLDNWQVYLHGLITSVVVDPNHWLLMDRAGISNIDTEKKSHFILVPNPAKDKITLHFIEPLHKYKIYIADSSGRILFAETGNSSEKTIDISKLAKGTYFAIIYENKEFYQTQFIKN
jgi:aminopeptidase N